MDRLFSHLYHFGPHDTSLREYVGRIKTPPYVSSEASVHFVDYGPGQLLERYPILMLFTDGVDRIVEGYQAHTSRAHGRADAAEVVTYLLGLSEPSKARVKDILGHETEVKWNPKRSNRAVDILGNLLGGTDINRLKGIIAQTLPADSDSMTQTETGVKLDLDDTTVILCDLTVLSEELERLRKK